MTHLTSGVAVGAAALSPTGLTLIQRGTVSINPASLATVTSADTTVTLTGVATGDTVVLNPPTAGLTAGMQIGGVWVSAADTVKLRLYNGSGGTIDEAAANWTYAIFR